MSALPPPSRIQLAPQQGADGSLEPPISLSVHEGGQGPAIVLLHGFPELAFSWRKQFQPLVDAGFRTIVPDQRGYGASDAPRGSQHYDMAHLTGDLVHLLDALEIEKAIFAGHDWGGFVAWAMPVLHPDRTAGVIGVNTPYLPRSPIPPTQALSFAAGGDVDKIYILWFQEPGVAESVLDQNPRIVFEKLMRRSIPMEEMQARVAEGDGDMNPFRRLKELPETGAVLLSEEELDFYTQAFTQSGFHGGISWYRNFDRNWEQHPEFGVQKISHPSLMITAENDMALQPALAADMPSRCEDLETIMISQCGHWTQQEKPEELNRLMIDWLTKRFG
ncbi:MAG: alpha/beta hydrolase [Myxococcota bacterium]|nr:alpha/beta hydrolase [Myxococcota bacterium]